MEHSLGRKHVIRHRGQRREGSHSTIGVKLSAGESTYTVKQVFHELKEIKGRCGDPVYINGHSRERIKLVRLSVRDH